MTGSSTGDAEAGDSPPASFGARLAVGVEHFTDRWRPVTRGLGRSRRHSRVAGGFETWGRFVRKSRIVRWLTAEPDPQTVVIDLHESATVGPFVRLAERLASFVPVGSGTATASGSARVVRGLGRHAVALVSAMVLGVVLVLGARTATGGTPASIEPTLWMLALGIGAAGAVLGLAVGPSRAVLVESRAYRTIAALLAPPTEEPSR